MNDFSAMLVLRIGLHFPSARSNEMLRGVTRAAKEFGFVGADACAACMRWLLVGPRTRRQDEILASHLTVSETFLFREPAVFRALERAILPPLVAARRAAGKYLRIWSAGCSSGEEVHSLAILLTQLIPDIDDWSIHLLGTDINPHRLEVASLGVYRDWSFRGVPRWVKEQCFHADDVGHYTLAGRFRHLARFAYLNLATDTYPSSESATQSMDLVMCRNVLMYFNDATARTVVQKLRRATADGGWLIVGQAEGPTAPFPGFVPVTFEDCVVYSKDRSCDDVSEPLPVPDESPPPPVDTLVAAPWVPDELGMVDATGGDEAPHSRDAPSLASRARTCADLHRLEDARRWCEAAIAADKCNTHLRYLLAMILTEQGDVAQAAIALRQVLYLDPHFIVAHIALGHLYRFDGHPRGAARHFATAARLLRNCSPQSVVPDADGLTAGRLLCIIDAMEHMA
ncbi:chemotaxis protein CheR [Burkholderia sp. JP2-270]|nr:chemotaxis protein CheR [Burkholderia sp. JP2-270]